MDDSSLAREFKEEDMSPDVCGADREISYDDEDESEEGEEEELETPVKRKTGTILVNKERMKNFRNAPTAKIGASISSTSQQQVKLNIVQ